MQRVQIMFILVVLVPLAARSVLVPLFQPFVSRFDKRLRNWVNLRTGGTGAEYVWHYEGTIRNTLSGSEVVSIEGIERTRLVDASWRLALPWVHRQEPKGTTAPYATFLSNKVFVYTNASDPTSAIYSHRVAKASPKRDVDPVKHLIERVTVGRKDASVAGMGKSALISTIEWPGGRTLSSRSLEFTVPGCIGRGTGSGALGRKQVEMTHFIRPTPPPSKPKTSLSRWVSFAPGPDPNAARSLEYYTAARDGPFSRPRMVCRRQGECPAWYAPGRQCSTEITAVRYKSLSEVPQSARSLLAKEAPDSLSSLMRPCTEELFANGKDALTRYSTWYTTANRALHTLIRRRPTTHFAESVNVKACIP
jgi:hypothetical protein